MTLSLLTPWLAAPGVLTGTERAAVPVACVRRPNCCLLRCSSFLEQLHLAVTAFPMAISVFILGVVRGVGGQHHTLEPSSGPRRGRSGCRSGTALVQSGPGGFQLLCPYCAGL